LTPQPAGMRFVHTHVMVMSDLNRGTYTGQFGIVYIEPRSNPGQFDQEVFLCDSRIRAVLRRRGNGTKCPFGKPA